MLEVTGTVAIGPLAQPNECTSYDLTVAAAHLGFRTVLNGLNP